MAANATNIIVVSKQNLADRCTRISGSNYERSWQTRWPRRAKNQANWLAYHTKQDWSHKLPWQTTQCVSEFGISIEQSVGTLERGLTDSEDWLTVDGIGIGAPVIDPDTIGALLRFYLQRLWLPGDLPETSYNIANLLGDGVKRGLLESILTAKVYGVFETKYQYRLVESKVVKGNFGHRTGIPAYSQVPMGRPSVVRDPVQDFRLACDLIPWEDYFPDPSALNKWVCHEVSVHLSELGANPDYDEDVVNAVRGTADATYADQYKRIEQGVTFVPHEPDEVRVREFWGDLIDPDTGEVLATNAFWTTCNGRLLRPPTPNPFWHGKRPFVSAALFRTPNSTVHKALADDAVDSWCFLNELISLMFDGALGSVWGKHQARLDKVTNSDDFQQGIPQAATFLLDANAPDGYKALETIDDKSGLPPYAMAIYDLAMRQFQTAMATNDMKLGQQPAREQTATCVPLWAEALTRNGWKRHEALTIGEELLGFNEKTKKYEWTRLEAISTFEDAETALYMNAEWRTICTTNHRWVCERYDSRNLCPFDDMEIMSMDEMNTQTRVVTTADFPAPDGPGLGMLRVEEMLTRKNLVNSVLQMTQAERQAFIVGSLAGEGHTRPAHGSGRDVVVFVQNEGPVLDAFRLACFLEGIRTSAQHRAPQRRKDGSLTNGNVASQLFYHSHIWKSRVKKTDVGKQAVWCPTTALGTWVMRQGDYITITGNSVVEAMQAAGSLFESVAARIEDTFLEPLFELSWLTILQYEFADKLIDPKLVQILGPDRVLQMTQMTNEERFVLLAQSAAFKCRGLRGITARSRILTKLANMVQLASTPGSPLIGLFAPGGKYSMNRLGEAMLRNSGIDPTTLEKTQEEKDQDAAAQMVDEAMNAAGAPRPGTAALPGPTGESPMPPGGGGGGGSPPALLDASQEQQGMESAMASKTPAGQIPGQPGPA